MQKVKFNQVVEDGLKRNKLFMVVKIETEGNPGPEVIVNSRENFAAKISYYDKAYNDNMELIAAKNNGKLIRITDVIMTSNFNDLNWFIY